MSSINPMAKKQNEPTNTNEVFPNSRQEIPPP